MKQEKIKSLQIKNKLLHTKTKELNKQISLLQNPAKYKIGFLFHYENEDIKIINILNCRQFMSPKASGYVWFYNCYNITNNTIEEYHERFINHWVEKYQLSNQIKLKTKNYKIMKEEKIYLSRKQAAEILGLTPQTIYLYDRKNKIQSFRIGRNARYLKSEIEALIKKD